MQVNSKSIVALSYTLTNNSTGEIIEKTPDDKIMKFKFGIGELLPLFEKNIVDLNEGDSFDFIVPCEDAYGKSDPYGVFDLPLDTFESEGKIDFDMLKIGNVIPLTDNEGNKHMGKVLKVMENAVAMDFNHPLAGIDLRFTGKVLEVFE